MPKVVQLRSCGEKHRKTAQKADIFQMSIYLCFFEDAGIYIYIYPIKMAKDYPRL